MLLFECSKSHLVNWRRTAVQWSFPLWWVVSEGINAQSRKDKIEDLFLSAAKGQRPRNYSSSCSSYKHIPTNVNLPSSTYLPVPIPKYQYIIAADPGAGIGLVEELYSKQHYAELKCSTDNTKVKPYLVAIIKLNGRQDLIKVRNRYLLISWN